MNKYKAVLLLSLLIVAGYMFFSSAGRTKEATLTALSLRRESPPPKISPEAVSLQDAFISVAEHLKPAVVSISTVYLREAAAPTHEFFFGTPFDRFFEDFFEQRPRSQGRTRPPMRRHEGMGSGVIIDSEGRILTNEHVVRGADEIQVTLYDADGGQREYKATVVGADPKTDLAVIKITSDGKFPYASLGDSEAIKVGQWVVAVGSPFGLEQTVTIGVVSARRQVIAIEGRKYRDLIQTDAAINRGNSGGPLVNLAGEVIGINTAIFAPTGVFAGVGFAVPINRAKSILDEMIKTGRVIRGWLGVEIRPVDTAIEKNFNLPNRKGAFVNNVVEDSPAAKAGIKRGDVIVEFDGKRVDSPAALQDLVSSARPEKRASLRVIREGREKALRIVTGTLPDDKAAVRPKKQEKISGEAKTYEWKGTVFSELTEESRAELGIKESKPGVVVVEINRGDAPLNMGLRAGDLVRRINNKNISKIADAKAVLKDVDLKRGIVFDIVRGGRAMFITYYKR